MNLKDPKQEWAEYYKFVHKNKLPPRGERVTKMAFHSGMQVGFEKFTELAGELAEKSPENFIKAVMLYREMMIVAMKEYMAEDVVNILENLKKEMEEDEPGTD